MPESDLLGERYHLGAVIGEGGMGVVHRAWDTQLSRHVAVKILRDRATDPAARARFRTEGETLARLSHPSLITVFDTAAEDDVPYLVMELVDGVSLTERSRDLWLDVPEVVALGADLADALAHVHLHRIVHRDVKPANVLIGRDGRARLADFGVARLLDGMTRHTSTGMTVGTAGYLSPEQVRGEEVTGASDVYSLGLVLIEAVSGQPAFVGTWDVVALARLTRSPQIDPSLPGPLRELLTRMTASDPARRPVAAEVARALRGMAATADRMPVPASAPTAVHAIPRSRAVLVAAAAALLVPALLLIPWISGLGGSGSAGSPAAGPGALAPTPSAASTTAAGDDELGGTGSVGPRGGSVGQQPGTRPGRIRPAAEAAATARDRVAAVVNDPAKAKAARQPVKRSPLKSPPLKKAPRRP